MSEHALQHPSTTAVFVGWLRTLRRREPDFVIGGEQAYLRRWWLIPKNRHLNIYLHHFCRSDDDRALHCHPWWNMSLILRGRYVECLPGGVRKLRRVGIPVFRRAEAAHRVELLRNADGSERAVWTLFITGPKVREWGFHCPKGWRHWREFTNPDDDGATTGPGCGD